MKVDGTSISPVGSVQAINRVSQADKKALVSEKKVYAGIDKAAVSDKAQIYQELVDKVKSIEEISNPERINNLAQAISEGSYSVKSEEIAAKLLGH